MDFNHIGSNLSFLNPPIVPTGFGLGNTTSNIFTNIPNNPSNNELENLKNLTKIKCSVGDEHQNQTQHQSTKNLFNNEDLSDIKFTFGEEPEQKFLFAHSLELCKRSEIFKDKFQNTIGTKKIIPICDYTYENFSEFIKFLYCDECNIKMENVMDLLNLAKVYHVNLLKTKLLKFVNTNLSINNVCFVLEYSPQDIDEIKTKINNFIIEKFNKIAQTDSFNTIKYENLEEILKLNIKCPEPQIFKAIIKWSESQCTKQNLPTNGKNKRNILANLLYLVRFPIMSLDDFIKCLKDDPEILDDSEVLILFKYISGIARNEIIFPKEHRYNNNAESKAPLYQIPHQSGNIFTSFGATKNSFNSFGGN